MKGRTRYRYPPAMIRIVPLFWQGWRMIEEAAETGYPPAMIRIAWAKLLGTHTRLLIDHKLKLFWNSYALKRSVADLGCLYRITDTNFYIPDPASKRYLDPDSLQRIEVCLAPTVSQPSEIWSEIFTPSPDPNFFPSRIPDPGPKKAQKTPDLGSRIRIWNTAKKEVWYSLWCLIFVLLNPIRMQPLYPIYLHEWMEWMNGSNRPDCMRMRRQDLEGGRGIMEQLTQVGNPEAQMGMGFLYATGQIQHSLFPDIFPAAPTWNLKNWNNKIDALWNDVPGSSFSRSSEETQVTCNFWSKKELKFSAVFFSSVFCH